MSVICRKKLVLLCSKIEMTLKEMFTNIKIIYTCKKVVYFLKKTIFKAVDELGEEIVRIFSFSSFLLKYSIQEGSEPSVSLFLDIILFQSFDKFDSCFGYIILIHLRTTILITINHFLASVPRI